MRIGIDAQSTQGRPTGIGYYAGNLFANFNNVSEFEFQYYKTFGEKDLNTLERLYWENFTVPALAKKGCIDLLHIPGFAGTRARGRYKKVTTVCDLIGMIYPQNMGLLSRFYWQKWLPQCVKSSDMIIAISNHTKNDIIRLLGISEDRIRVTLLAVDDKFHPIRDEDILNSVHAKYNLPERFMLCVSTIEPRKNIIGLIRAFNSYITSNSGTDLCLVIAGKKGWDYNNTVNLIKELNMEDRVVFTDYIQDKDLPALYNLAEFFVYLSFYEGFGLPVLEALACGKAVICSDTSSLPEVTGDAAVLVNPVDIGQLGEAIEALDNNSKLREELSAKALVQAGRFSWKKTADATIEVYKEVLGV